jgi:omega-6 fatty acid desaturase (delta-12 desaturase)
MGSQNLRALPHFAHAFRPNAGGLPALARKERNLLAESIMNVLSEKDLVRLTVPFTAERRARSWVAVGGTSALLFATAWVAASSWVPLPVRLAASVFEALLIVRAFVIFHDVMHGAILRGNLVARAILHPIAWLTLTPPRIWRETHNYHHAHTAKLVGSHVGSFATTTPRIFASLTRRQQRMYLAHRHPLNMCLAFFTVFAGGMCLAPLVKDPKKNWDAAIPLVAASMCVAALWRVAGVSGVAFAYVGPEVIASALGAYLFYAQHNCPGLTLQGRQEWSNVRAALGSSSFMRMGPAMRFFTANIGWHHLHHLNPAVPYYRLPELAAARPELAPTATTSLRWDDVRACLRLKFWSPEEGRLIEGDRFLQAPVGVHVLNRQTDRDL